MAGRRSVKRAPSADAATLGEPSYVWRSGQERRLSLIRRYVALERARILDVGCGIGTYVLRFRDLSSHTFGIDVSLQKGSLIQGVVLDGRNAEPVDGEGSQRLGAGAEPAPVRIRQLCLHVTLNPDQPKLMSG